MLTIDMDIARRFILGQQGLWPGRLWRGMEGTAQAIDAMEYLQLDPLQVIARSQDIALHSRVLDYTPGLWEELAYQQRQFFDWGGWLAVRPMDELPHWRVVMRREREGVLGCDRRIARIAVDHGEAVAQMRAILRERGTVTNRDFEMASRQRTQSYRGRKDSSLALYHLWRVGEVMTHHRENFERVYALTESVAPSHLVYESSEAEADRFLIRKEISFHGLSRVVRTQDSFHRGVAVNVGSGKSVLEAMREDGEIVEVQVEGWKAAHYVLGRDVSVLDELRAGCVPTAWTPLETSTTDEAVFLSPLEPVSARGRAKALFDFDYVWEVYKPAPQRKFGYYTLPVLWGERLVARFDSKLDRTTNTFAILGLWLEDVAMERDEAFGKPWREGLRALSPFWGQPS